MPARGPIVALVPAFALVLALPPASHPLAAEPPRALAVEAAFPEVTFDPAIPSPEAALGFRSGARAARHDEVLRYLELLETKSKRARVVEYGRTHEGRRLVYLAVGDEATIAGLDAFRAGHVRRMDPRGRSDAEDRAVAQDAKAVAFLAYGIHGDELSSVDAALLVAYRLVAGEDEWARSIRRELVVLVEPCQNPDGRERFLSLTTSFAHRVPNPDTEDLSHVATWPFGRGNHYLFDLNRDWFTMVQPESRRAAVIASWLPQLVVDSHEMGPDSTYLFSPARPPFNPRKPAYLERWADLFAADQARALDRRGYGYFTGEWNEEFFPGYGSSWASYLGAVGILYEMAGTDGTLVRQRQGHLRTYAQAVDHQLTSSIANLETLRAGRAGLLAGYLAARREAVREGAAGGGRAWLIPPGRDPARAAALAALLGEQGIEVLRLGAPARAESARDIRTGEAGPRDLPAGTYMVPLDQPAAPLARVLLEPHVPMDAAFLREEREYLERGKGTRLYETTAWSLPLCYGVDAYWTGARPKGDWQPAGAAPPPPQGRLVDAPQAYAFAFDGVPDRAAGALADLLARGLAVRVAEKAFTVRGRRFDGGAVVVPREGNPDTLREQLRDVAVRHGVVVEALETAKAESGPDLGGEHFGLLLPPRIGVLTGSPVAPASYGAIWYLLDAQLGLRFSALDVSRFAQVDLSRYNVLVLPAVWGSAEAYRALLGDAGLERLRRWIEGGGTAIGFDAGADFLADPRTKLTRARLRRHALDTFPPLVWGPAAPTALDAGLFRATGLRGEPRPDADEGEGPRDTRAEGRKTGARKDDARQKGAKGAPGAPAAPPRHRASPYDVAPVIGPGAAPFVQGVPLGTPADPEKTPLGAWIRPFLGADEDELAPALLEEADERLRRFSPRGAFLRVDLDPQVWLNWGLPEQLDALVSADDALIAAPPVVVAARFPEIERLHLGGLLWPEAAARFARTAYVTREAVGRGQVVLFADDPVSRGWALGTRRLFVNALLLGPGLGTQWPMPW